MKLTNKDVKIINKLATDSLLTQRYIALCYDISQPMVSLIKNKLRRQGV
jgi:DNA-binding Lrp family transcriptional regulator